MISWRNFPFNPPGTVWPLHLWRLTKVCLMILGGSVVVLAICDVFKAMVSP